jgi:hypothetical protein
LFDVRLIAYVCVCSLHNYSTRCDSLDLNVVDVPKLLTTTYQLKEQLNTINEQQQEIPLLPLNGGARVNKDNGSEKRLIRKRIHELEHELTRLKSQLKTRSTTKKT